MRYVLFLILIYLPIRINGQQFPDFKPARYDEDYSFLENDTLPTWYKNLKYRKIEKNAYLGFGGEFKTQYLIQNDEEWGSGLKDKDGYMLTRWLFHVDLHLFEHLRFFGELQSALANGKDMPIPIEENPLGIHQLFVDVAPLPSFPLTLRIGRQEVAYGAQRFLSFRDGPNSRRSFDGIKAMYATSKIEADVFYLNVVVDRVGLFDDFSSPDRRIWGLFSRLPTPNGSLSLYYLGFNNVAALFYDGPGVENRQTLGARILKRIGGWQIDVEGAYQFGSIGDRSIAAWSTGVAISYSLEGLKYFPELGLKADYIGGDKDPSDQVQQTLNAMFPPGAYFGLAAPIAPSNLIDVHPSLTFDLSESVSFYCDYAMLWRNSKADGLYRPSMTPFFTLENEASSRFIGTQLSGTLGYNGGAHLFLESGFSWFDAGPYLREVTEGKDILFGFVSVQFKF